jgi:hypothetical protein
MFKINDNYLKLPGSYLFSTIGKKVAAYQQANPDKEIIRLGIGDVTQPLAPAVIDALHKSVDEMGHAETFHGYAPDLGYEFLRSAIADHDYKKRGCDISADEIFVSDGAKSDSGNIGDIFSVDNNSANLISVINPLTLHQSFQKKHRISYICVSLTIQQVQQLLRMSFRSGLITLIRLALLLSMMQHMKHTFQNRMFLIQYMSVKAQEHVQSNSDHSLRMQDLQA